MQKIKKDISSLQERTITFQLLAMRASSGGKKLSWIADWDHLLTRTDLHTCLLLEFADEGERAEQFSVLHTIYINTYIQK